MSQRVDGDVARAVEAFERGDPVLVHDFDDREGETDLVYPADVVTVDDVARLRNDAGGLVCVALSAEAADSFGLPYADDVIDHPAAATQDIAYDDRSSFSLSVNHRETFTGITDADRALTIGELAAAAAVHEEYDPEAFAAEFRAPGHVQLLRAAPGLLTNRRGHTELGLALAAAADRPPAVVVCEMLADETGGSLSKAAAREYAERNGLVFVEGRKLIEAL